MSNNLTKTVIERCSSDIISAYENKGLYVNLLLTINCPLGVTLSQFTKMVCKLLKNREFGLYFYSYEISENGKIYVHIVTSNDFNLDFQGLKGSVLRAFDKSVDLDYRIVSKETWKNSIKDLFKCKDSENSYCVISKKRKKFGGSKELKNILSKYEELKTLGFSSATVSTYRSKLVYF